MADLGHQVIVGGHSLASLGLERQCRKAYQDGYNREADYARDQLRCPDDGDPLNPRESLVLWVHALHDLPQEQQIPHREDFGTKRHDHNRFQQRMVDVKLD